LGKRLSEKTRAIHGGELRHQMCLPWTTDTLVTFATARLYAYYTEEALLGSEMRFGGILGHINRLIGFCPGSLSKHLKARSAPDSIQSDSMIYSDGSVSASQLCSSPFGVEGTGDHSGLFATGPFAGMGAIPYKATLTGHLKYFLTLLVCPYAPMWPPALHRYRH